MIKENIYIFKKDYGVCYTNNNLEYFIFDLEDYELISERIWTRNKLRITTRQQNSFNKHPVNKIMGVYYEADRDKWCAMLYIKDKGIFRKRFATQEEAIKYRLQCEL